MVTESHLSHLEVGSPSPRVRGDPSFADPYPPPPTPDNSSTEVTSRLLESSLDSFDVETELKSTRSSARSSRVRLHPLTLLPAFICGLLFASTITSWTRKYSIEIALPKAEGFTSGTPSTFPPDFISHSSGHIFLNPSIIDSSSNPGSGQSSSVRGSVRHPIHDLIRNATQMWESKLARQSKTLDEAVTEYKRRYRRSPPKGFDAWFSFAQENGVILIDEFDSIHHNLLPFHALSPAILQARSIEIQNDPSTFSIVIRSGKADALGPKNENGRAVDQLKLMERWRNSVDDVNITISVDDGPRIMMDWKSREKHNEAGRSGEFLSEADANTVDDDASLWGYPLSCSPNSRIRRFFDGLEIGTLPPGPSFVQDHLKTMDLCSNPEWQDLHGFTSWPGSRPSVLRPLFSFSKTSVFSDILLTPLEQYHDTEQFDPAWDDKPFNKINWRGSTTGVTFNRELRWRSSQRMRLHFTATDKQGSRRVRFDHSTANGSNNGGGNLTTLVEREVLTSRLVDRYLDFEFSGEPNQCNAEDGSCEALAKIVDFKKAFGWNQANEFKYLLDVDGNAWSGRFHRLLSSNSVVLKSTIFPEWYSGWIQPWVHYIPVKVDYSDLFDLMAFFSGDMEGKNGQEELAKKIASQGKEYTAKHWRYADMEVYFYRLVLEWARCTSFQRESMDYEEPGSWY